MTDSTLLNDRINGSGLKVAYIAEKMSISRQSLSNKINGKTQFKTEEIKMLSKLLNIDNPEDLYEIFFKE